MGAAPAPLDPSTERWAIDCQHCGRRHSIRPEMVGKQFVCKGCGKRNPITPPQAALQDDEVLVATPIATAPAMPTAEIMPIAEIMPTAEIVYTDDQGERPGMPADDRFGDAPRTRAGRIPMAAAPPSRLPASKASAKKKKKRRAAALDAPRTVVRVIFGCITAVIGAAIVVWGIYALVNPDAEVRRPGRAIALGAVFLSAGVKWVMGSSFSKD